MNQGPQPAIGRLGWHDDGCGGDDDIACTCFTDLTPRTQPLPHPREDSDEMVSRETSAREAQMWKDLLQAILLAPPEPGLPGTTVHLGGSEPELVIYYTRYQLSETELEMIEELNE